MKRIAVLVYSWPGAGRRRRQGVHRPTVVVIEGEACTCIGPGYAFTWWSWSPCRRDPGQGQRRQRRQGVRCPTVVVIQGEAFGLVAMACTCIGPGHAFTWWS